jgi:hypothetical protein
MLISFLPGVRLCAATCLDHRHGVLAHLGGAGLVPAAHGGIPDEALEFGAFEVCLP